MFILFVVFLKIPQLNLSVPLLFLPLSFTSQPRSQTRSSPSRSPPSRSPPSTRGESTMQSGLRQKHTSKLRIQYLGCQARVFGSLVAQIIIVCPSCNERKTYLVSLVVSCAQENAANQCQDLWPQNLSPKFALAVVSHKERNLNTKTELEPIGMVPMLILCYNAAICRICLHHRQEGNDGWQWACSPCIIDPFQMGSPKVWLRINVAYYQYYDFFRQLWRDFLSRVDE